MFPVKVKNFRIFERRKNLNINVFDLKPSISGHEILTPVYIIDNYDLRQSSTLFNLSKSLSFIIKVKNPVVESFSNEACN